MTSIFQSTSNANRIHIGFFGRMNAGKSSIINAFTDQHVSIVSDTAGTTTDVVKKPMEIHGIGACVLYDTAGFDDHSQLGKARIKASENAASACDLAVILFHNEDISEEQLWLDRFRKKNIPVCGILSRCDEMDTETREEKTAELEKKLHIPVIPVSVITGEGLDLLRLTMIQLLSGKSLKRSPVGGLVNPGDTVMLVMPQDPQAPEGRLIQPEVMTIRDCLDHECITVCVTPEEMNAALDNMIHKPDLIITDSQAFKEVYKMKPESSRLTSFSVLMASLKGDIKYLAESASAIGSLTENSKVLIAECCTHAPMEEDIGRVKIPRLLRQKAGSNLVVDIKAGTDFPDDASEYDLIIQCGGCMFNRRYVMNRIDKAKEQKVPMTNYGIALAYLNGILEYITLPEGE